MLYFFLYYLANLNIMVFPGIHTSLKALQNLGSP
jgi:hypothetical protein